MRTLLLLFLVAFLPATNLHAGYIFGTPSTTVNTDGWALFSSNMQGLKDALQSTANFGPGGVVNNPVTLLELNTFSPATLAGVNGLIIPWWLDSESTPFVANIITAFNSGMDLVLLEDDSGHDLVGETLGLPTTGSNGSNSTASGPFATGPFGAPAANSILQSGNTGQKSLAAILALGGLAGATNGAGQVTAAYWSRGTFNGNANAGALVIFGDVDMASIYTAIYPPGANDNGIFSLNGIAFVVNGAPANAVPEPGTWFVAASGAAVLLILKRRRRV